jgi:hypothetical protein
VARHGAARLGGASQARLGRARHGEAGHGVTSQNWNEPAGHHCSAGFTMKQFSVSGDERRRGLDSDRH